VLHLPGHHRFAVTPSWCIRSIALLNSPRAHPIAAVSPNVQFGAASSFSAITAISCPGSDPSRTRMENRPLPAIRPHPVVLISALAIDAFDFNLLRRSISQPRVPRLDEADQFCTSSDSPSDSRISRAPVWYSSSIAAAIEARPRALSRSSENPFRSSPMVLTPYSSFPLRHHARKRRHILLITVDAPIYA